MDAKLSRNATVADGGVTRSFLKGRSYAVDAGTYGRLKRIGALVLEPEAEPQDAPAVNLAEMKKDELLAHAEANGVTADASMTKAEIIAAIEAAAA